MWLVQMDFSIDVALSLGTQDQYKIFFLSSISFVYVCLTYFYATFPKRGWGRFFVHSSHPWVLVGSGAQLEGGDPATMERGGLGPVPSASVVFLPRAVLVQGLSLPCELSVLLALKLGVQ